jgi:hypothetical protein
MALNTGYTPLPDTASPKERALRDALFAENAAREALVAHAAVTRAWRRNGIAEGWLKSRKREMWRLAKVHRQAELDVDAARAALADPWRISRV